MLIDCSYFTKGTRHILNATLGTQTMPNPNAAEVNNAILAYIGECQEQFLTAMLGASLGNKFHTYLVCLDENETQTRIAEFDKVCDVLREPFADYVFFHILRDMNEQATITGLVRLKTANTYVAPIRRQVNVWNAMVDRNRKFAEWSKGSSLAIEVSEEMVTKINVFNL